MYLNKAMLFGNLTRDPELRALPSGMNVANFSVATNRVYKDKDGKKQEQTDFHKVVVFGRTADTVNQYLKKGSWVYVEGRMQTRSWEQDGEKKYRTEFIAEAVQFGPKSSGTKDTPAEEGRNESDYQQPTNEERDRALSQAIDGPVDDLDVPVF